MRSRRVIGALTLVALVGAGCGSTDTATSAAPKGDCPTAPVSVVVTVDQWGDIVDQLGGDCATVTTVIKSTSADPHEYEPTPGDAAEFEHARLVVRNGLGYDPWAAKAIATLTTKPAVVDAGSIAGLKDGDNPHIWYSPTYVRQVSAAVTAELARLEPKAAAYFARRQSEWQVSMAPYDAEIAAIRAASAGTTYAATEPVFDDMADALGMQRVTPSGYEHAALNESDPSPADIAAFEQLLRDHKASILMDNTQTQGPTPQQLRDVAVAAGIPIVKVTETVPPGVASFVTWQVDQLKALGKALGA